jgi:transcriptional regulator with XRE-family HTH domain
LKQLRSARHKLLRELLVAARVGSNLTQRQLSIKLGRGNSFVWKFEAGERRLDVLEFIELAQHLGLKASTLIKKVEEA